MQIEESLFIPYIAVCHCYNYQLSGAICGIPDLTGVGFTPGVQFREQNLSYDPNGNIKTPQRTNAAGTLSDDFNKYSIPGRYQ